MRKSHTSRVDLVRQFQRLLSARDELNNAIRELAQQLGIPADNRSDSNRQGFLADLSYSEAAASLLSLNPGQPLTTKELLRMMEIGGKTSSSQRPYDVLFGVLRKDRTFVWISAKHAWGLATWNPLAAEPIKQLPKEGAKQA